MKSAALWATCLANMLRPQLPWALALLLRESGVSFKVPEHQTCCGQPWFNAGDLKSAAALARRAIKACAAFEIVIVPSGSCAAMMRRYPLLFPPGSQERAEAEAHAQKTFEALSFLATRSERLNLASRSFPYRVAYHDSCASLRSLSIRDQPRALLAQVRGLTLVELAAAEQCCGFGGSFAVDYPELSAALLDRKIEALLSSRAEVLAGGDLGCLLHIGGRLAKIAAPVRVVHALEILAGLADATSLSG